MPVKTEHFELKSRGNGHVLDITGIVEDRVKKSQLRDGIVTVFVPGSTAAVSTIEYEDGLVKDIHNLWENLIPQNRDYFHNYTWGDGNGHAHLRAYLLGPSLTVPFTEGRLTLGTWQQIVLVDFDNRPRSRRMVCQIMGE